MTAILFFLYLVVINCFVVAKINPAIHIADAVGASRRMDIKKAPLPPALASRGHFCPLSIGVRCVVKIDHDDCPSLLIIRSMRLLRRRAVIARVAMQPNITQAANRRR